MHAKKIGYFLSLLLLSTAFLFTVDALPDTTASFRGIDVTIDLTYPEEAHPNTTITYDVTITANTNLTSINIGILIYAPVNSTLQLIKNQPLSWGALHENESLPTSEISILLPEQTNGTLYCNMTVQTEMVPTTHYASYSFYTTLVHTLTFSEMQSLYEEMLANYTALQANYTALLNEYNSLLANYNSLFANYTALLSEHTQLLSDYNSSVTAYESLENAYNTRLDEYNSLNSQYKTLDSNYGSKINDYNTLQKNYNELNSTHNSLQANFTSLQADRNSLKADYDELNQTYTDSLIALNNLRVNSESALNTDRIVMLIFMITLVALIAFIIYLKRGKEEPYVVIRKETVNMKQDEKS